MSCPPSILQARQIQKPLHSPKVVIHEVAAAGILIVLICSKAVINGKPAAMFDVLHSITILHTCQTDLVDIDAACVSSWWMDYSCCPYGAFFGGWVDVEFHFKLEYLNSVSLETCSAHCLAEDGQMQC